MSKFAGIKNAMSNQGGNWFKEGEYVVKVLTVKMIRSQQDSIDRFIVECEVLESSVPEIKAGSARDWVVNMRHKSSLGNIKGFMAAATDSPEHEIDEEVCDLAVSEENPMAGVKLGLSCRIVKKQDGGDFTKHNWSSTE